MICDCASCGATIAPATYGLSREATLAARGLCTPCYDHAHHAKQLDDYPRRTRSRDEVLEDWDHLRRAGVPWEFAHERLGMSKVAFERAYERARHAGDERALAGIGQRAQRATTQAAVERAQQAMNDNEPTRWASAPSMQAALNEAFGDDHAMAS